MQIIKTKHIDEITPRLQRIRMRLMRFNYKIIHVPGKQLVLGDALSRNPLPNQNDGDIEIQTESYLNMIVSNLPATRCLLQNIHGDQECDYVCDKLKDYSRLVIPPPLQMEI